MVLLATGYRCRCSDDRDYATATTRPALAVVCNPTTNSYKRLVPGFEAPMTPGYSSRTRSASIRIPMYSPSPKAKQLEFRSPDPS
jgi:glutamine synthetase